MQVVIALPPVAEMGRLECRVCGVTLLVRVMATALRSGGSSVLLVLPPACPRERLAALLNSRVLASARIDTVETARPFDPGSTEDWRAIAHALDERFLWMPCDYLAHKQTLAGLLTSAAAHPRTAVRFSGVLEYGPGRRILDRPAVFLKGDPIGGGAGRFEAATTAGWRGMSMRPPARVSDGEAELVRGSGKATDGIYSRFNRRLCRPAVRWLSHTPATPNAVTFAGLAVAVLAGLCFAQGTWLWGVAGAALFFVSGLFDEIDGMLARLTFQESAFGCWLETMVDYATYLIVFAGMTVGRVRAGLMDPIHVVDELNVGLDVSTAGINVIRAEVLLGDQFLEMRRGPAPNLICQ